MITQEQVKSFAKKYKTNETTILREYIQLLWLSKLYGKKKSEGIFFKGGTAIHFIYKAPRFSEDLDFTVSINTPQFEKLIKDTQNDVSLEAKVELKEKKTIAGRRFLITALPEILPYKVFVNLDFSFREKVFAPQKSIIDTDYPVIFSSFVHHISKEEMFAEKIRAIMTRKEGRDLYDLWYLTTQGATFRADLVKEKLKYYKLKTVETNEILKRVDALSEKEFVLDLRPFVPINERDKLTEFYVYIKKYLQAKLG